MRAVTKHAFASAASLSLTLLCGVGMSAGATDAVIPAASFSSPVAALKSEIAAYRLEKFSGRFSFSADEWFERDGERGIAAIDLALHTGQIRFVPESIRKAPEMAVHRWTRYNGEMFLSRALKDGHVGWIITNADYKNPVSFWNRDVEGMPASYRLIEDRALESIPVAIFQGVPHTYWRDKRVNQRPLIGWVTKHNHLQGFFAPSHWVGRMEEMNKAFNWVREIHKTQRVSAATSMTIQRMFSQRYNEVRIRTKEIEHGKQPDVHALAPRERGFTLS